MRGLGLWVAESDANFIWLQLPEGVDEGDVVSRPARSGACSSGPGGSLGREGALRVTVGTEPENERFVAALAELL